MKKTLILVIVSLFSIALFAQNEATLITIGKKKITSEEFVHIYKKNNSVAGSENSINEYLDLFINFKLKVHEAENLQMDTAASFRNELAGYREQLAKPYLIENLKIKELVKQQYERSLFDVKMDIIFVSIPANAEQKKWDAGLEKANLIIKRLDASEDFEKVAKETSDDKSVSSNGGHLPYLPVIRIPYSLQSYIFSEKTKGYSQPIKTNFGYYIVKIIDKRASLGSIQVAHIMLRVPNDLTEKQQIQTKARIDSIYKRLSAGDNFKDLAKLSDDKGTANKGGELPWFSTGRMVPEFESAAFGIKQIGEYTKPVKTTFGWHIIKLIDKKAPDSFDKQKQNIEKKVTQDPEMKKIISDYVINKLKKDFDFKEFSKPEAFYTIIDSSIFKGKWKYTGYENAEYNKLLFKINGVKYDETDFGKFLENKQVRTRPVPFKSYVDNAFIDFIYESLVEIEKDGLESKHPEFKFLMQEYHDGILLFDLTKIKVWDKASNDSLGLKKFYDDNKSDYKNNIKLDLSIFKYSNKKYAEKAAKILSKQRDKYTDEQVIAQVANNDIKKLEKIGGGEYSKNENMYADKVFALIKAGKIIENQKIVYIDNDVLVYINNTVKTKGKEFNEIKGIIIADYQNYLEKLWVDKLKDKYNVKVNKKTLENIKL